MQPVEPYGITFFCEDIRQEATNQLSLVGVFPGKILFPQLPIVIPKLGVVTRINIPWGRPVDKITWKVFFPGDHTIPSFQSEISVKKLIAEQIKQVIIPVLDEDISLSHNIQQQIVLSPVQIKQAGFIKVRIIIGDEIIKVGAISVELLVPKPLQNPTVV